MINHYEIIGAHASMNDSEIRDLYRKLARVHHPDRGGSADKFAAVSASYRAIATSLDRSKLAALYSLHVPACNGCGGTGAQRKQRGFTAATLTACPHCHGCGYSLEPARPPLHVRA